MVYRCKMCGAVLQINGETIIECEYCGAQQTVSKSTDEVITNLFDRANNLRLRCEFDKAEQIYEKILDIDNTDAEAHWGVVLCKYGIEYVEDPKTFKRIPTCHRTLYDAVTTDVSYISALENADQNQKQLYIQEAAVIDKLQKDILNIVNNEKPFDVFICYKETDENGKRTPDSVIANDIYYQLKQEGFKVFYAAITLEDKLGREYEPYIFAALNSAKVMLVIGTKPQYFDAVWVRNEWSRFLKLMKTDRNKLLIPCYRDMDAYELPEAFAHLQAQDMSKIGFINDVVRGIKKVINKEKADVAAVKETIITSGSTNVEPLLKRAFMFLEDGDFTSADDYCEKVLDIDPENALSYLGKLMVNLRVRKQDDLKDLSHPFEGNNNYQKVLRFADTKTAESLKEINTYIKKRNEQARLETIYQEACALKDKATFVKTCESAAEKFKSIIDYKDSAKMLELCILKIKELEELEKIKNAELEKINAKKKKFEKNLLKIAALSFVILFVVVFIATSFNFNSWTNIVSISAGYSHTVGLKKDGTVVAVGYNYYDQCDVDEWTDIVAVSTGDSHTVGLKKDGTVVAVGENEYNGQCDVENWTDIVAVSTGDSHTVGLKKDGTVVAVGNNVFGQCDVDDWNDIVAISVGDSHTVGLKKDGTVVAVGKNEYDGQCDVDDWTDIIAISAGGYHTIGLKSDGTVVAVGDNVYGKCDVENWTDIVAVSTGDSHTVGLKSDGTVVAVGYNYYDQCDVDEWTDIVAVSAGQNHTVGLKSDGTVVAVGYNYYDQCDVGIWKGFFGF